MKRFVHGLLVATLLVGSVAAKTYTDKTFLAPRSHGMNMAMEYTGWHKQTAMIDDNKFGGTVQLTGFYEESNNKCDLAKYFGVRNWRDGSCCINDYITVVPALVATTPLTDLNHLSAPHVLHPGGTITGFTLADKIRWRPDRKAYGIRLDYHQKLDKLFKGLFFKVTMPIVHVKTSMNWCSTCDGCNPCATSCADVCSTSCSTTCGVTSYCVRQQLSDGTALNGEYKSLGDYLTGCVTNDDPNAKQAALCKAKIHNGNSKTGLADIDVILGYNFLYEKDRHVNLNIGVTIPTGNSPKSEYLWEAIVGNHGHWALGFGLDGSYEVWKDTDKSIDLVFAFNYRYLFSGTEKRIPGFIWPSGTLLTGDGWAGNRALYGHWWLGAKLGETTTAPMANFLARDLKVTPGSHFEAILQAAFNYTSWTFDVGYNFFYKDEENVRFKDGACSPCESTCESTCADACSPCDSTCASECGSWTDDTYAITWDDWDTSNPFAEGYVYQNTTDWINRAHLCLDACTNPSVVTHKLYGGATYAWSDWEYPLMLGVGGSYEWETDNDCLNGWALWAKVGLTF